jgi:hypothetical protein
MSLLPRSPKTTGPRAAAGLRSYVRGEHGDPFSILSFHRGRHGASVRVFLPDAKSVSVVEPGGGKAIELDRLQDAPKKRVSGR